MPITDAYSDVPDLLIGDITPPARHGDGTAMIKSAAEDIDSQIGHIYETPVLVNDDPKFRPTRLLLKKINNSIASGRLLLDFAAASEDTELHAYGKSLLDEGLYLLRLIVSGEIALTGVTRIDQADAPSKVLILNEDPESLVEGFYRRIQPGAFGALQPPIGAIYGGNVE